METDTIAAISTPIGEGGISIVRVSGPEAIDITKDLFSGKKSLSDVKSHTIHYGKMIDPETSESVEEVMATVFKSPKTYTKEDIVEINCHGGLASVNRILDLMLTNGARLAEPGEYTKRAFLNGRIDLSQAEAVMDLIRAKTDKAMSVAHKQMEGRLSELIRQYRQDLLETVAHVEVNIDYPEYDDVEEMSQDLMRDKTKEIHANIEDLLKVAKQGKILREGIATAIIGRPNVGKSSLMNVLSQEDKAIVTEIPGTTRDVVEEYVNVRGIPLKLADTAGIRETEDIVEKMGVDRSHQALKDSDLILFILNYNEPLSDDDWKVLELIGDLDYIIIINKTDLPQKLDMAHVNEIAGSHPIVETSITESQGIDELEDAIANIFFAGELDRPDMTYVSNVRHIQLLRQAKSALEDAMDSLEMGMPLDIVQIDVRRTWEFLGEIIGDTASDSLIDQLFSQFCLGK